MDMAGEFYMQALEWGATHRGGIHNEKLELFTKDRYR